MSMAFNEMQVEDTVTGPNRPDQEWVKRAWVAAGSRYRMGTRSSFDDQTGTIAKGSRKLLRVPRYGLKSYAVWSLRTKNIPRILNEPSPDSMIQAVLNHYPLDIDQMWILPNPDDSTGCDWELAPYGPDRGVGIFP